MEPVEQVNTYPAPDLASHPLVEAVTDRAVVLRIGSDTIYLSEGLTDVLSRAGAIGLHPVIATNLGAQMTFAARYVIEMMGGRWLEIMADETYRSPFTGARYEFMTDPVRPERRESVLGIDALQTPPTMLAAFSVSVHHAATESLVVGEVAEVLAQALAEDQIAAWNVHEPALLRWNRDALTKHAKSRMPGIARVFVVGASGRFQASIAIRRTDTGVDETITGIAAVPGIDKTADALAPLTERARTAMRAVAEQSRMPLQGTVSATPGWTHLWQLAGRATPPVPLSLLVGPRAAHHLDIDLAVAAKNHRVEKAGSGRLQSLVTTFRPSPEGSWEEIAELARLVGLDRIRTAGGIAEASGTEGLQ